ncbi:serine/threonine-protein kinase CDL1 isoform X1 [Prunus yedoensis var. nudiflora]|uniref:Serine/threonine-protein kinase CDL1 isoform X1 n=1 Tax=Prunus yedoensis var. nudiflora TaxID=2094558 RepID=A0A314ZF18_PRUYE|nr:serine/threonine-protein kinase CDL1 isoform X1 [Prunus yedoensis var. nudiflora]
MEEEDEYRRKERLALLVIVVLASLAVASLLVAFSYYCYIRNKVAKRFENHKGFGNEDKGAFSNLQVASSKGLQVFTFKQLHSATGGFSKSNVVGKGGFGLVYRGVLHDGRKVAIKFMDEAGKQGAEEFKMEVELLSRLCSPYLLALLGYCSDNNHKLLVYEFMANGGLQEHLYPGSGPNAPSMKLDWETRLRIALEAAKGLEYLHEHISPPVIHRDFKSSNILLDKYFHAKVSDFGLAKLGSDKAGGYVSTRGQYSMKEVIQVAAIAAMCVQPEADYRPLMADVVQSLVPLVKIHRSTSKVGSSSSFHATKSPTPQSSKARQVEDMHKLSP